jgi:hypothetical protein
MAPIGTPAVAASSQVSEWTRILGVGASDAIMYTKSNTNVTASPKEALNWSRIIFWEGGRSRPATVWI